MLSCFNEKKNCLALKRRGSSLAAKKGYFVRDRKSESFFLLLACFSRFSYFTYAHLSFL